MASRDSDYLHPPETIWNFLEMGRCFHSLGLSSHGRLTGIKIKPTYDVIYLTTNLEINVGGLRKTRRQPKVIRHQQDMPGRLGSPAVEPRTRGQPRRGEAAPGGGQASVWKGISFHDPSSSDAESNNILWIPG